MPRTYPTPKHKAGLCVVAALALIAAACGGNDATGEDASDSTAVDITTAEETLGPEQTTTSEVAVEPRPEVDTLVLGGPVEPGRYATDLLGTTIEVDLDADWIPAVGDPGGFIINYVDKQTDFSEGLLFTRMSSFASPSDFDDPAPEGPFLAGPADDFDGWLDASGELLIDSDRTIDINGTPAREVQVRIDPEGTSSFPGGCGPGPDDRCFFVGGTQSETLFFYIVRTSEVYRMWLVPQEGFDEPILITAIATEGNEAFLDAAGDVVASMTFGQPKAHPVELPDGPLWEAGFSTAVPAGEQMVPALGGLRFEMTTERFVFQDQQYLSFQTTAPTESPVPPGMVVAAVFTTPNGTPIDGVVSFLDILGDIGTVTLAGDTYEALGQELLGFDFIGDFGESGPGAMSFSSAAPGGASNFAWAPGNFARLYVGEMSGGGVLVVGYEGMTEADELLGKAVFDDVAPTLSLAGSASTRRVPPGLR